MKEYYLPPQKEIKNILNWCYISWHKEDSSMWSNCDTEIINYIKNWRNIRIFVKKSYLKWQKVEKLQGEYLELKSRLKNIIPNQSFIDFWNWTTFAFCVPVNIKIDVFKLENKDYLIEMLNSNPKLLKQLRFFIKKFKDFEEEWKILDLYWKENLIISDDNKLYYVDSFLVFHKNNMIKKTSIENIKYLQNIISNLDPHR